MYIYEIPFNVNKELCRLLDNDDYWKELAGERMKYTAFEINEIEQTARRYYSSPTHQLFIRWGQLNHKVEELFILLYQMKHVPALRSLRPLLSDRFDRLLNKLESRDRNGVKAKTNKCDENGNKQTTQRVEDSNSFIPLPVMLIEQGVQVTSSNITQNGTSPSIESSTDISRNSSSSESGRGNYENEEILKNVSAIPKMTYEELKVATNNWSENNLLGKGGFGQVFKGEWKHFQVAVKRLTRGDDGMNTELIREMCLNQYRHDNILPLYGYSLGGPEACLVYQLMAGGSLEHRIRKKTNHPPLTWVQRYRVAVGVASGLQYLHNLTSTPLIHGDIKPANILLDQCLMPKIGDFGLARKGSYDKDGKHLKVSKVYGTRAYLPHEYIQSHRLSPAVDVFSYGVVIIEMATALLSWDGTRKEHNLYGHILAQFRTNIDLATLEDPAIFGTVHSNPQLCRIFISIGLHCTSYLMEQKPTMLDVYKRLDAINFPGKHFI